MLADNRLTENSEWDTELLGEELKILSEAELTFGLEATGFEMGEIDLFIENLADVTQGSIDPADILPEPSRVPVSRLSDVWALGKHRVVCGNALSSDDFRLLMQGSLADVVFTDPPYNLERFSSWPCMLIQLRRCHRN